MSAGWVAASVRARAMARRRLGLGAVVRLARAPTLDAACEQLAGTAYADVATGLSRPAGLAAAQRAVADATLWQFRVLAGWLPSSGTVLARAAVAAFERENLLAHLDRLTGRPSAPPFELGTLSTAWNRVRSTSSAEAALAEIAASPWGEVTSGDLATIRDELTAAWLHRMSRVAPSTRPWVRAAAVLLVARCQVVEARRLPDRAAGQLTGPLGRRWPQARSLDELRDALGPPARAVLDDVSSPDRLWVAEAALWGSLADRGTRLLREPIAGPAHVVGAMAALAADAFRVNAALAAAATGTAGQLGEVLGGAA